LDETEKGENGTRKAFLLVRKVFAVTRKVLHEAFSPGNALEKGENVT
jgi:hypothetical protein